MKTESLLEKLIRELLCEHDHVIFEVGRNGDFDILAASVVRRVMRERALDNGELWLIMPYWTREITENFDYYSKYYDSIEVPYSAEAAHPKAAFSLRNKKMIDKADLVVCYVERESGGAYKAMKYALRQDKRVINLADSL